MKVSVAYEFELDSDQKLYQSLLLHKERTLAIIHAIGSIKRRLKDGMNITSQESIHLTEVLQHLKDGTLID